MFRPATLFMGLLIVASASPSIGRPNAKKPADTRRTVCVEGYDSRLCPRAPFQVGRLPGGDRMVFVRHLADGRKMVMVAPDETAKSAKAATRSKVELGPDTASTDEVLASIGEQRFTRGWQLTTDDYRGAMPPGVVLWSTADDVAWPFELTLASGSSDQMIYVQGPMPKRRAPKPKDLLADGMRTAGKGSLKTKSGSIRWVDFAYEHGGATWTQRRYWVPLGRGVLLVTAQAAGETTMAMLQTADEFVSSLRAPN